MATASLIIGLLPLSTASVAAAAVLASPTLTNPTADASRPANPVLAWTAVPGAAKYRVELSLEPGFSPLIAGFPSVTTQELRYAPPAELPLGQIYWRVAALDAANTLGTYASSSFVKLWGTAPTVLAPAAGAKLQFPKDPVLFSWKALPGAVSYELEIDDADDFIGADSYKTKNTAFVMTEPVTINQTFYWRLRGVSGAVSSAWSQTSTFTSEWKQVPTLVYPAAGANGVTDVYFDWNPVLGARAYQLQVSPNGAWANNTTIDVTVKSTRYTPAIPLNNAGYFWRVRSLDAGSPANYGPWSDGDRWFQRGWSDTPTILWPTNGTSTTVANPADPTWQNPTFSWTPARHASWYRIRFATNPTMGDAVGCITNRTTWTPYLSVSYVSGTLTHPGMGNCTSSLVKGATYYWDVAALDNPVLNLGVDIAGPPQQSGSSGAVIGLRSPVKSFVYDPPTPSSDPVRQLQAADYLTPANCDSATCNVAEGDTPVFSWTAIPGATTYTLTVSLDPNFTSAYRVYTTNQNRLAPRDSWRDNQANQAYYWNVTPNLNASANGLALDSSSRSMFQKRSAGIHRTAPAGGSVQADDFTFQWQDYLDTSKALAPAQTQEAKQYRIEVSTVSDFATVADTRVVNTPFYTPYDRTYPEGPIYWRVQAIDGSDNDLTVSDSGSVTKKSPAPALVTPLEAATVKGVPYLQWNPLPFAASYDVQLATDRSFSSPIRTATTKMTAWAHVDPLAAGTYYWRVRRNDADDRDGAWSAPRTFVLQPQAPTLTSPVNGANPSPNTLLLEWAADPASPRYRVELSTSDTFASQVSGFPKDTVMSSWAPTSMLTNGTYYWRVRALNAANTPVATSSTRYFTVDSTNPSVTGLSPSSSAAITAPFTVTFSEPVIGVSGKSFAVTLSGTSTVVPGAVTVVSPTAARFTPRVALMPGQTYTVALSTAVTDKSGNPLVPYSSSVRTSTTVEENSVAISRAWARWKKSAASGGALKLSQKASSKLTFPFSGTSITLLGYQGTKGGYASISLDGVLQTNNASFYRSSDKFKVAIWSASGLPAGAHTLSVVVNGAKPKASKGTWVFVDGFIVDGSTVEENSATVSDGFRHVSASRASGGGYDLTDFATGSGRTAPSLSFTFRGTGVTWYGVKGSKSGKAAVYIDGVKKKTVDLYASRTSYRQKLWASTTISNTVHTIKVVILGSKRSKAKGYEVAFDSFTVR
ncbi:MAG TPA: Ig-like domain-containing protein [Propionicimonas sp.]|uniref:Ig-like domain-containing protein n=1 Tax=Propionicimonas sp. TaxID=1955623 RepID=UPI002F3F750B